MYESPPKFDFSDYAIFKKAAKWRGVTLEILCENIVNNYLCDFIKETHELFKIDPETQTKLDKETKLEHYANYYNKQIRKIRKENAIKTGNITKIAKPASRLKYRDVYPKKKTHNPV